MNASNAIRRSSFSASHPERALAAAFVRKVSRERTQRRNERVTGKLIKGFPVDMTMAASRFMVCLVE